VPVPDLEITPVVSAPFEENSYILRTSGQDQCLVVDPGFEPEKIVAHLDRTGLAPAAILNTHGHCDHIAGNAALKLRWPACPLVIGRLDAAKLSDPVLNLSAAFGGRVISPPADRLVGEGDVVEAAGIALGVREIPGHSSGHVVFITQGLSPTIVLGGDVLFADGVGRTDFPDSDFAALAQGIRDKLFTLPDDSIVLPGHGPPTTVGREKRTNPFVGAAAGYLA
jgi:glyoxylase-like metal-dependent hydrolase (beta-lactamase superfamily II)